MGGAGLLTRVLVVFSSMCGHVRRMAEGEREIAGVEVAPRRVPETPPETVLHAVGALIGKVGGVFAGGASRHGGQESTVVSFHTTLLHQGMVIVGLPCAFAGLTRTDEVAGCPPYGASTSAGGKGGLLPSENELAGARFQGRHVSATARKLTG